jgi:hypothetical protein
VAYQCQAQCQLLQPLFGDLQFKQNLAIWRGRRKGLAQSKPGFVLLLINELATDCVLSGKVADLDLAAHGLDGQIDALD